MKTFPIGERTLEAVFGYLARCPFADVEQLVVMLRQDIRAAQLEPPVPPVEPPVPADKKQKDETKQDKK